MCVLIVFHRRYNYLLNTILCLENKRDSLKIDSSNIWSDQIFDKNKSIEWWFLGFRQKKQTKFKLF